MTETVLIVTTDVKEAGIEIEIINFILTISMATCVWTSPLSYIVS